jgi:hypothetical protein
MAFSCIMPLLKIINLQNKFSQARDVFVYNYIVGPLKSIKKIYG